MNKMVYEIEEGIPIPERRITRDEKYGFSKMKVGQSFKIDIKECARVSRAAGKWGERHNKTFTVRRMPDGTARCWRRT